MVHGRQSGECIRTIEGLKGESRSERGAMMTGDGDLQRENSRSRRLAGYRIASMRAARAVRVHARRGVLRWLWRQQPAAEECVRWKSLLSRQLVFRGATPPGPAKGYVLSRAPRERFQHVGFRPPNNLRQYGVLARLGQIESTDAPPSIRELSLERKAGEGHEPPKWEFRIMSSDVWHLSGSRGSGCPLDWTGRAS